MNFLELKNSVAYIQKNCPCLGCKGKHRLRDISILAATKIEGLFELKCGKCHNSSIITIVMEPREDSKGNPEISIESEEQISNKDIKEIKNFLEQFDGNFKEIFE